MDVHTSPIVLVLPDATHQAFIISRYSNLLTNTNTASSGHYGEKGRIANEKGLPWGGYEEDRLPDKLHGGLVHNVRFQVFPLYLRLFGVVLAVNMGVLVAACVSGTGTDARADGGPECLRRVSCRRGGGALTGILVGVCGLQGLGDEVRCAVASFDQKRRKIVGGIELHEEAFGW